MAAKTVWLKTQYSVSAALCLFFSTNVQAYYCDNDKCADEEYCCGENMCCKSYKVWDLWYFWCGFLFFIFLLSSCTCLWRYRYLTSGSQFIASYSYAPLQEIDTDSRFQSAPPFRYVRNSGQGHNPSPDTPPPYSQVSAAKVKFASPPPSYAQVVGVRDSF